MTGTDAVLGELRALGFAPEVIGLTNYGASGIAFDYSVPTGRYRGQIFRIAISFQEDAYPEYPPHFLHVRSLPGAHLTAHSQYELDGASWMAFSVPPSDFWDRLPPEQKNMKTFFNRHIQRVWDQL